MGVLLMNKIALLFLVFAGTIFAGQYTTYCLDQTDPCFQANCYKVNGNWGNNPSTGKVDCMYDTRAYSSAQVNTAFATCIAESNRCEQLMEAGNTYTYTPSGSSPNSSGGGCCGSIIFIGALIGCVYLRS